MFAFWVTIYDTQYPIWIEMKLVSVKTLWRFNFLARVDDAGESDSKTLWINCTFFLAPLAGMSSSFISVMHLRNVSSVKKFKNLLNYLEWDLGSLRRIHSQESSKLCCQSHSVTWQCLQPRHHNNKKWDRGRGRNYKFGQLNLLPDTEYLSVCNLLNSLLCGRDTMTRMPDKVLLFFELCSCQNILPISFNAQIHLWSSFILNLLSIPQKLFVLQKWSTLSSAQCKKKNLNYSMLGLRDSTGSKAFSFHAPDPKLIYIKFPEDCHEWSLNTEPEEASEYYLWVQKVNPKEKFHHVALKSQTMTFKN